MTYRVGNGFDIHNLSKESLSQGNPFILGGVLIDSSIKVEAHSDGDTLLHAVIDSVLGALGKEDIGDFFPNTDKKWKNADSKDLLARVLEKTDYKVSWIFQNLDITLVLESPKLGTKKSEMKEKLSDLLKIDKSQIAIKAKTFEDTSKTNQVWVYATTLIKRLQVELSDK